MEGYLPVGHIISVSVVANHEVSDDLLLGNIYQVIDTFDGVKAGYPDFHDTVAVLKPMFVRDGHVDGGLLHVSVQPKQKFSRIENGSALVFMSVEFGGVVENNNVLFCIVGRVSSRGAATWIVARSVCSVEESVCELFEEKEEKKEKERVQKTPDKDNKLWWRMRRRAKRTP